MKVAILAAGNSLYFPYFIDKPKSLYHINGETQLDKVIKSALRIVDEKDIIVVSGYKYKHIELFLKKYPNTKLKINKKYSKQAIYSFMTAIENENDDFIFVMADETISNQNYLRIYNSNKDMALLTHDDYYYYSLGIFKLKKEKLSLLNDNYLKWDYIKDIYCFANNKTIFDGNFNINSGICIGYIIIDLVRKIGKINKIENPNLQNNPNIDFLHYNPKTEYMPDIDRFEDTDEYKQSLIIRIYYILICKPITFLRLIIQRVVNHG